MKKVLLGLLALSATIMAEPSTGVTGNTGDNQIDITTKAFIVDSGLIITDNNGTTAIKSIELDHGTIMKTNTAASSVNRNIYIKKTTGTPFPTGSILEISLKSSGNDLTGPKDSKIPHTLTATVDKTTATTAGTGETNVYALSLASDKQSHTNQFSTAEGSSAINVNLKSDIAADTINTATLVEGAYSNTSTLSVKFSKIPTAPGTSADSQPAGTSR